MVLSNPKFSDLILGTVIFLESMQFPLYPMVLIPLYVVYRTRRLLCSLVVYP